MIDGTNLPYADTSVSIEKSKRDIDDLLRKFGCRGIQWTWIDNSEILRFIHEFEFKGVKKGLTFEMNIPEMGKRCGRGYDKRLVRNDCQAYRVVLHIIKAKLTAVESGVESFENEFLSKILYKLPDGHTSKVGDIVFNQVLESKPVELLHEGGKNE